MFSLFLHECSNFQSPQFVQMPFTHLNFLARITLSLCFPKPHGQDIQSKGKRREKKLWWFYKNNTLELQNWSQPILVLKEKLY